MGAMTIAIGTVSPDKARAQYDPSTEVTVGGAYPRIKNVDAHARARVLIGVFFIQRRQPLIDPIQSPRGSQLARR